MYRRMVGMKTPGRCREVAVSGGSTVVHYLTRTLVLFYQV